MAQIDQLNQKQILSTFWQKLDQHHFDLNQEQKQSLRGLLLQSQAQQDTKILPIYTSYEQYSIIKEIAYFKYNSKKKIQTLNNQNIKKYLYLYENSLDPSINQKLHDVREILRESYSQPQKHQIKKLKEEEIKLDEILRDIKDLGDDEEIEVLLNQLEEDQQQYSRANVKNLLQLQKNVDEEYFVEEQLTLLQDKNSFYLKRRRPLSSQQQEEVDTIKKLIVRLQEKQTAESISKVQLDYKSIQVKQFFQLIANQVMTWYDPHITDQVQIIDLDRLSELQRLRDVPQTVKDLSTRSRSETLSENQIFFCHFCKQSIELSLLMQCTYSSETMGLPEYNEDLTLSSKMQIDESKRNKFISDYNVSNYQIKKGHLICKRYFCQNCLKYECDIQIEDCQKKNWLCPLCNGLCSCSRCQRNDILQKLKRMYIESGGELQDLDENSYFEQLVRYKKNGIQILDQKGSRKSQKEKKAQSKLGDHKSLGSTEKISVLLLEQKEDIHSNEEIFFEEPEPQEKEGSKTIYKVLKKTSLNKELRGLLDQSLDFPVEWLRNQN